MKVALLGPYPPDGHLAGGVDAVVWALAEGLAARPAKSPQGAESPQGAKSPQGEVELHVLTAAAGLEMPVVSRSRPGLTLHQVPLRRGDRLLWHWPFVRSLIRTLQAVAPDVVHAHGTGPYAAAALGCGRPAVITPHGVIFREAALAPRWGSRWAGVELPPIQLPLIQLAARLRWMFDAWYERWIVRRARDLIAISPYVVQEYRPLTRARFHTIENPVADVFFDIPLAGQELAPRTSEPGAAETERGRMLCVARLIPRKDILTLLHAFARVRAAVPGTRLEIAGQTDADTSTPLSTSPPYTRACLATVAELGLEGSVHFLGEQHGAALVDCYARADLVLLTSRQETAPVVVAEAMAAGRPVVATRVGGVPYMVADGQTGLLADAGDPQGLADATIALLSQPERRRAYGEAGRKAAWQRFRLEAVVQRTVELYASMLATNRSRRLPASGGAAHGESNIVEIVTNQMGDSMAIKSSVEDTRKRGDGTLADSTGNSAGAGSIVTGAVLHPVVRKAIAWLKRANRRFPLKLGEARRSTFCPKLWDEIYISDKGVVYSCCHEKPRALGSLHEQSLKEICNNALIQNQRRRSLSGRLECYDDCTLLKKDEIVYEEKPLTIDYGDLKRIKILFGEGCNISCVMCTQNHRSRQSLDYDVLVRNVDLAPFESIELQGGEPLFIMAARRFFDYAAGQGKKVSFLTNGIIINDEWAEKIALHSAFVYFSLNAATKETHELINRGSRWEVVLRNIQRVRAARERLHSDLRIVGHMTLVPQNLEEIPLFIESYREFGFDSINFGYDLSVPVYLKSGLSAARKQALITQIAAVVDRAGGDHPRLNLLRLQLLGLV